MASLKPHELFLERIGDPVWEDGYRCGIDFGAECPDQPGIMARPTIGHIIPKERGGTDDLDNLRPECQLCYETARNLTDLPANVELLKRRILELG